MHKRNKMKFTKISVFMVLAIAMFACNNNNTFRVNGTIRNAEGKMLYFQVLKTEKSETLDSVKLNKKGTFSFKTTKGNYPDFYFITLKDIGTITLADDSSKIVSIQSDASDLLLKAEITGSESSKRILSFSKEISAIRERYRFLMGKLEKGEDIAADRDSFLQQVLDFKARVGNELLAKPASMFAYFVLYQKIDNDLLLYSAFNRSDYKYFAAVATNWDVKFPESPRSKALHTQVLSALKQQKSEDLNKKIMEMDPTPLDIALPKITGDTLKLSSLKGNVVILNFWRSDIVAARNWNKILKNAYNDFRQKGVDVYQVSFDKSKILWEEAMDNDGIGWNSVATLEGNPSQVTTMFNVRSLPTTYIVNRKGDVVKKVSSKEELYNTIKENL